ncbi:unnamed protein product [Ectocarpus sp. CCAP 1310/34]|nr:unnamed protein product [Ectocarpus sp. CCAP 1310/34]
MFCTLDAAAAAPAIKDSSSMLAVAFSSARPSRECVCRCVRVFLCCWGCLCALAAYVPKTRRYLPFPPPKHFRDLPHFEMFVKHFVNRATFAPFQTL